MCAANAASELNNQARPTKRASDWRPHASNTLRGFFNLTLPSGLVFNDYTYHEQGDKRWVGLPGKPQIDADGRAAPPRPGDWQGLCAGDRDPVSRDPRPLSARCTRRDRSAAPRMITETLALGLAYAGRGWPLLPMSRSKHPLIKGNSAAPKGYRWAAVASTDSDQLTRWSTRWPSLWWALATGKPSGLVVLDIDTKDPKAYGFDTLADIDVECTQLPDTPMVHTASGGLHVYFALGRHEIGNSVGKYGLGPGLDVRGTGGYAILPTPGNGYQPDPHWNFETVELALAPGWLARRTKQQPAASRAHKHLDPRVILEDACDAIGSASAGERHAVLNRETFRIATMVRAGALREGEARHALAAAAATMVARTGGDRGKAEADFDDAWKAGLRARARR
jgi:hypothetical protein